jgi:hypothetical protein
MAYAPSLRLFYMHPIVRKLKKVRSFEIRFLVVHLFVILRYWFQLGAVCRYGPEGVKGTIPGNAWLTFDVELVAVKWELLSLWLPVFGLWCIRRYQQLLVVGLHRSLWDPVYGNLGNYITDRCSLIWAVVLLSGHMRVVFCRFGMCSPWCRYFKIWCGSILILIWCLILRCPLH